MPKSAENITTTSTHRMWSLAVLSLCVIIFSITVLYVTGQTSVKQAPLTVTLKSDTSDLKVGKPTIVNIYFSGLNASHVLGADFRVKYDSTLVKITHAEAGPFFNQPLIVKWDQVKNTFALASNPGVTQTLNPMLSVVKLEVTPLKAVDKLDITLDPATLVYIEKKGSATIQTVPVEFTVKK